MTPLVSVVGFRDRLLRLICDALGIRQREGIAGAGAALKTLAKRNAGCLMLVAGLLLFATHADASSLAVRIDISEQSMQVDVNGQTMYQWPVSTARRGYRTPRGRFRPIRLERVWYSTRYDLAPMPHSVFFHGGYAIHGTTEVRKLGRPVSHGCIRLRKQNARILFDLVRTAGFRNTTITIRN